MISEEKFGRRPIAGMRTLINQNSRRAVDSGFLLGVLLVISVFLIIAIYAHPIVDDYNFACYARWWGLWGGQWQRYQAWTGRFVCNFLALLFSQLIGLRAERYWIVPVLSHLAIWGGILLAILRLVPVSIKFRTKAAWSAVFFALYLSHLPDIRPMYWMTSISTYGSGTVFALLLLALMPGMKRGTSCWRRFLDSAGAVLAAVLACGSSETVMIMVAFFLLAGTALCWRIRHPQRWRWTAVACFALAAALVVCLAPGNAARAAEYPQDRDPTIVFRAMGAILTGMIWKWFLSPGFLLSTILFLPLAQEIGRLLFPVPGRVPRWAFLLPLIWLAGLFVSSVPTVWATGRLLPIGRTQNPIYLLFLLGWFFSLVIWLPHIFAAGIDLKIVMRRASLVIKPILLAVLFTTWNTNMALQDLFIYGRRYRAAQEKRSELIRSALARGERSIQVPRIGDLPRAIFFVDLTEDPTHWSNKTYAFAHGLHSIWLEEESSTSPEPAGIDE